VDEEISSLLSWVEEFQALSGVISGNSYFAAAFSVESILKLLHDFDYANLLKFPEALSRFPDARNTSRIRPNEDVQIIKARFAKEFWFASGKEFVKKIARAKLEKVEPLRDISYIVDVSELSFIFVFFQLIQEETRGKSAKTLESSSEDEEEDAAERKMTIQVDVTKTAAIAAIVTMTVELELTLNAMILPRRLTSSIEMLELPL
jgi:hypothetical protein